MEPHTATRTTPSFAATLQAAGLGPLRRRRPSTLQVNVGKLCNQTCRHCHVEAGPGRKEIMTPETAERVLELLSHNADIGLVDLTGGAPELNPSFRRLVRGVRAMGRRVSVRSNLTVLLLPEQADGIDFFVEQEVEVIASLPCYTADNVDRQRGDGVFDASIEVLRRLNARGYARAGSRLMLDLVYNPLGPSLPPDQARLEKQYHRELERAFGIRFNRLFTITNMPIKRFAEDLARKGRTAEYMELLVTSFRRENVEGLMCRDVLSVDWEGRLYDCDFNQMLELPLGRPQERPPRSIWDVEDLGELEDAGIRTGAHCFGCTAGSGSSCTGALT